MSEGQKNVKLRWKREIFILNLHLTKKLKYWEWTFLDLSNNIKQRLHPHDVLFRRAGEIVLGNNDKQVCLCVISDSGFKFVKRVKKKTVKTVKSNHYCFKLFRHRVSRKAGQLYMLSCWVFCFLNIVLKSHLSASKTQNNDVASLSQTKATQSARFWSFCTFRPHNLAADTLCRSTKWQLWNCTLQNVLWAGQAFPLRALKCGTFCLST